MADDAFTPPLPSPQHHYSPGQVIDLLGPIRIKLITAAFAQVHDEELGPFSEDRDIILSEALYEARRNLDRVMNILESPPAPGTLDSAQDVIPSSPFMNKVALEDIGYARDHLPEAIPFNQVLGLCLNLSPVDMLRFCTNLRGLAKQYAAQGPASESAS